MSAKLGILREMKQMRKGMFVMEAHSVTVDSVRRYSAPKAGMYRATIVLQT